MSFSPQKLSNLPVYQDASGYWARPTLTTGKRVWRKLDATEITAAVCEWKKKSDEHEAFCKKQSQSSPWEESLRTFRGLAASYLQAGCPRKGIARDKAFCDLERQRIEWLNKYWGDKDPAHIRVGDLDAHADWRRRQCKKGFTGSRTVELEWVTLSNVLSYGVRKRILDFNYIAKREPLRSANPGSSLAAKIRHAREVAPRNGDDVDAVAESLMLHRDSQPAAWFFLFACLTGLRRSELLRLRIDAQAGEPGHSDDRVLYVRRSKLSLNHTVLLHPDLEALLEAHFTWHQEYEPGNPFFFPGRGTRRPVTESALCHILAKACDRLKLPHFTPHGCRSFFATVLRSQRLVEAEVASRIGDRTVRLIQDVYGGDPYALPKPLVFVPSSGLPVWQRWRELCNRARKTGNVEIKPETPGTPVACQ